MRRQRSSKAAVEALKASTDLKVILVGQEEAVQQELSKYSMMLQNGSCQCNRDHRDG